MYDLIIVGAGPTGISCAIEAKKKGLSYIVLEKGVLVNSIYHFPTNMTFFSTSTNLEIADIPFISHRDKPTRREALEYYRRLVFHYDIPIHFDQHVDNIESNKDHFSIICQQKNYTCKRVILATGFYDHPQHLNIPGENLSKVKHYYDDAHPYINKKVLVVGAANSACDVALETWQNGAEVTMAVRSSELYHKVKYWILPNIQNRIKEGSIKAYFNTTVSEIKETSVMLKTENGLEEIQNDFVLAMTGYTPDYAFLERIGLKFDGKDRIPQHREDSFETNIKGLYIAGVLLGGLHTSKYFIENTRIHAAKIINSFVD